MCIFCGKKPEFEGYLDFTVSYINYVNVNFSFRDAASQKSTKVYF